MQNARRAPPPHRGLFLCCPARHCQRGPTHRGRLGHETSAVMGSDLGPAHPSAAKVSNCAQTRLDPHSYGVRSEIFNLAWTNGFRPCRLCRFSRIRPTRKAPPRKRSNARSPRASDSFQIFSEPLRMPPSSSMNCGSSRSRPIWTPPIPTLLKERLFVHLSRFCEALLPHTTLRLSVGAWSIGR